MLCLYLHSSHTLIFKLRAQIFTKSTFFCLLQSELSELCSQFVVLGGSRQSKLIFFSSHFICVRTLDLIGRSIHALSFCSNKIKFDWDFKTPHLNCKKEKFWWKNIVIIILSWQYIFYLRADCKLNFITNFSVIIASNRIELS